MAARPRPSGRRAEGAADGEVVIDPSRQREIRRRAWVRLGIPAVAVMLVVGALAGIAWFSYAANRRDAIALADEAIRAQEQRIAREVEAYLGPAPRALDLLRGVLSDGQFLGIAQGAAEAMGWQILYDNPQLALISYANPDGSYMMVRREPSGAIDTKTMDRRDGGLATTWTRRDAKGITVAIEHDPDDAYDPRTRIWYRAAADAGEALAWTPLYIFFSDQRPGVTAAQSLRAEDGALRAVFGVDIALDSLSAFLSRLSIGRTGRAVIVDADDLVIAHPQSARTFRRRGDVLETVPVAELGDAVIARVHNLMRVEGHGRRILEIDGRRHLTASAPIAAAGNRAWTILLAVPEAEFVGFVGLNNRSTLAMSAAVVMLVGLLAAILARQGLLADRTARLAVGRRLAREAQAEALAALAADPALLDPGREDALRGVTRVVARVAEARRAGVWRRLEARDAIRLEECRDREHDGYSAGTLLDRQDAAALFAALDQAQGAIESADAAADPRLEAFHARCLAPLGTRAVLIQPMRDAARWIGFVCVEDGRAEGTDFFAGAVAGMLAARYAASSRMPADGAASAPSATPAPPAADVFRQARLRRTVPATGAAGTLRVFEQVCVLTLVVADSAAMALAGPDGRGASVFERLAAELTAMAGSRDVDYARISGNRLVLATGLADRKPADAAASLAAAALEFRERALRSLGGFGHRADFRFGLDCGPALGAELEDGVLNLWGDAVHMAERLAETGLPGAIMVAEPAYRLLRDRFLFQARGHFYLDGAGEMAIYLLASAE